MAVKRTRLIWILAALIALPMPLPSDHYYPVAAGLFDAARGEGHGPPALVFLIVCVPWAFYAGIWAWVLYVLFGDLKGR